MMRTVLRVLFSLLPLWIGIFVFVILVYPAVLGVVFLGLLVALLILTSLTLWDESAEMFGKGDDDAR